MEPIIKEDWPLQKSTTASSDGWLILARWCENIFTVTNKIQQERRLSLCTHGETSAQSYGFLVKILIELTAENLSVSTRLHRESKCLIGTTKRVTSCQLSSIKVLCNGRLREPTAKLPQICQQTLRKTALVHFTQHCLPAPCFRRRLSAQPTP